MSRFTYPPAYLEYISLFNAGKFFEAHEVLEGLWRREKGECRDFYHGLIQIAAVFVHIGKKTPAGGKQLLETSSNYLAKYRPAFMGLDLEKFLKETQASLFEGKNFPKIILQD